ncbi:MAG: ABC transporter substrate-binding protein [Bdellovibrionales bacterium]|nr:ABC transporter substrate-binding protein [Bdellovibrionales bacterium]
MTFVYFTLSLLASPWAIFAASKESRVFLMEAAPQTLNPRRAIDANGQRVIGLFFRGLTRMTEDLVPAPDGSKGWKISSDARTWTFEIDSELKDDQGLGASSQDWVQCLENYRIGKPESALAAAFPNWKGTRALGKNQVVLELSQPDPYLAYNLSLLKFYRLNDSKEPCTEPGEKSQFIPNGMFRQQGKWNSNPRTSVKISSRMGREIDVEVRFVTDDQSRTLQLLSGEVDFLQNGVSLSKALWLKKNYSQKFGSIDRDGVNVSYLGFNLRDPVLKIPGVRKALAIAIDRDSIIRHKHGSLVQLASGFVSPLIAEFSDSANLISYDPKKAESLFDEAGFPRKGKNGSRLILHYRTTSVREGYEMGLMLKDQWKKVGIDLVIDVVEPALFLSAIKKGKFQLFSSRWVGVSDGSIYFRTLRTGQLQNRVGYSDAKMDALLDQLVREPALGQRRKILGEVEKVLLSELPYFPLFRWNNTLFYRKDRFREEDFGKISLSGAIEPIFRKLVFR